MTWYYVDAGQQAGPVTDEQLNQLVSSGKVTSATLVWREGMANWTAYGQVQAAAAAPPAPSAADPATTASVLMPAEVLAASATTGTEVVCSECRQLVPRDSAIQYGNRWVCANCKPQFVQRLKEGAPMAAALSGPMEYAGFWIRFLAHIIDQVLLTIAGAIIGFIFGLALQSSGPEAEAILQGVLMLVSVAIGMGYEVFFIVRFGATPGKMALRLKVVTADGGPISVGLAFGRYFAKILSACTLLIGYIIAAFDDEKRALHDRLCNTRVVRS